MPASIKGNELEFKYILLPEYAVFLLARVDDVVKASMRYSREMNIPLLQFFSRFTEEELFALTKKSWIELLTAFRENKIDTFVQSSMVRWQQNQLPHLEQGQVVADDITTFANMRKQVFLEFIPAYTKDVLLILGLVKEIDQFILATTSSSFKTFAKILEGRIEEQVEKLKQSDFLFKQAEAITHLGNYVWDLKLQKLTWSDELYRIYEISPLGTAITNEQIAKYNHPDDREMVRTEIARAVKNTSRFNFHYRIIMPDGRIKILLARGEVIADGNQEAHTIIGTTQDVTERENLIERLQSTDSRYRQAQALTHVGMWSWKIKSDSIYWSDELYNIYGLNSKCVNLTFETFMERVHPEDRDMLAGLINRSLETNEMMNLYHRIVLPDNTIKILHARAEVLVDVNGVPYEMVGATQDVTEQQYLEKQLFENQKFIQSIADAAPAIIASYNIKTGQYVFVNQGVKTLLGYEPKELLEKGLTFFAELVHPDDLGVIMVKNAEAVEVANKKTDEEEEMIVEFQYRMRHQNGEYLWFHTFGTVFDRNEAGEIEHVLNITLDITERVKAEHILVQRSLELEQSNARLEEFAFIASHDLKEPLRKISIFSDRLLSLHKEQGFSLGQVYLNKIMASSQRLQQMITDLLMLSQLSGDKHFKNCSLQKILQEALTGLEHQIEEVRGRIEVDPLPEAYISASQFRQLFQNLINNSLKFTKRGIAPVITIKHRYLSPNEADSNKLKPAAQYLCIDFSDNGIGFDNNFVEKIFGIFQRLHSKEEYAGTGIGLSICRKIIENHGGTIIAQGELGKGSTFSIIIPHH